MKKMAGALWSAFWLLFYLALSGGWGYLAWEEAIARNYFAMVVVGALSYLFLLSATLLLLFITRNASIEEPC